METGKCHLSGLFFPETTGLGPAANTGPRVSCGCTKQHVQRNMLNLDAELRPGLLPKGSRLSRLFWEGASSPRTKLEQQKRLTWCSVLAPLLTEHGIQADVQADNNLSALRD